MNLKQISLHVIKQNQHPSGAYIASPNFDNYQYSWLRDGSFIAYAMDMVSEHDSARRFYQWVHHTIIRNQPKLKKLYLKYQAGEKLEAKDFLPCRYTLEGLEAKDEWPNFQLDGYGTWRWGLSEHIKLTGNNHLLEQFKQSVEDTIHYLITFWHFPNSDCWEENEDKIHPSTLAAIYGGLSSINEFLQREDIAQTAAHIKDFLLKHAIYENRFVKYIGSTSVDASLLWLSIPFQVFSLDEEYMVNTVKVIEEKLLHKGGVHRFPEDTYYGGGEWLLLSSWLGWYYASVGRIDEAQKQLQWVESQADEQGLMTEQVLHHVNDEAYIDQWVNLWGPVAKPLLWSHAMYLILFEHVKKMKVLEKRGNNEKVFSIYVDHLTYCQYGSHFIWLCQVGRNNRRK
ncbi:glycoside hydrolase family 15 protein [Tepidibacillus decaturensis]|uniref:glycoside hydrolase family 15 protein n=1 Tax=Tepidibacillus decaturensis TaxID=1413211 RepID=UPI0008396B22|nr:glycoside hydrolase family 15 protein [Tepidibacillus decaturensis]